MAFFNTNPSPNPSRPIAILIGDDEDDVENPPEEKEEEEDDDEIQVVDVKLNNSSTSLCRICCKFFSTLVMYQKHFEENHAHNHDALSAHGMQKWIKPEIIGDDDEEINNLETAKGPAVDKIGGQNIPTLPHGTPKFEVISDSPDQSDSSESEDEIIEITNTATLPSTSRLPGPQIPGRNAAGKISLFGAQNPPAKKRRAVGPLAAVVVAHSVREDQTIPRASTSQNTSVTVPSFSRAMTSTLERQPQNMPVTIPSSLGAMTLILERRPQSAPGTIPFSLGATTSTLERQPQNMPGTIPTSLGAMTSTLERQPQNTPVTVPSSPLGAMTSTLERQLQNTPVTIPSPQRATATILERPPQTMQAQMSGTTFASPSQPQAQLENRSGIESEMKLYKTQWQSVRVRRRKFRGRKPKNIYCICERKCYGKMIWCDNKLCQRKWFHFNCVGITVPPAPYEGKWYCPICREL